MIEIFYYGLTFHCSATVLVQEEKSVKKGSNTSNIMKVGGFFFFPLPDPEACCNLAAFILKIKLFLLLPRLYNIASSLILSCVLQKEVLLLTSKECVVGMSIGYLCSIP